MFLVSGPDLVVETCRAGIVGTFPSLNQRSNQGYRDWLAEIEEWRNDSRVRDVLWRETDELIPQARERVVVPALLKAWDAALADYRKDTAGGRAIISEAVGAKPEELATAFDGVVYYSLAENKSELGGNFTTKVVPEVHAAARTAGILQKDVDLSTAIDARFVDAAAK